MLQRSGIIHESAYCRVEVLAISKVVKVTRLSRHFESEEVVRIACDPVHEALDSVGRRAYRLLVDTREVSGNNDPAYERWFEPHRRRMLLGFPRAALVMRTAIGKLHAERLLAEAKLERPPRVFLDEGLAMRYLAEE